MSDLIRVGVIGTGAIGTDHIRRISEKMPGAVVTAVYDVRADVAREIATTYGVDAESDAFKLISRSDVDAVLIASSDDTHAKLTLACLDAEKPVFCEKPLAETAEDAKRVVEREIAGGRRLVQVGFMRRYDQGYMEMKRMLDEDAIGRPLMVHCRHRNREPGPGHTTSMNITNSVIHEIDVLHWLLGEPYVWGQVLMPKSSATAGETLQDPQFILLRTESGVLIDVESYVSCSYGYDVQCEVVGDYGTISLPDPAAPALRKSGAKSAVILPDWQDRFPDAYDLEIHDWLQSIQDGEARGPSAWDGYVATYTATALTKARETGQDVEISIPERPEFYA
ncbi:MAG TPA: Gfo/Idh/MocA family oxidoreductase [Fastidiosipila sp.]|nr:Gfo/Idh/MocA family oxidoreductase [Fastidiosipila sp.]